MARTHTHTHRHLNTLVHKHVGGAVDYKGRRINANSHLSNRHGRLLSSNESLHFLNFATSTFPRDVHSNTSTARSHFIICNVANHRQIFLLSSTAQLNLKCLSRKSHWNFAYDILCSSNILVWYQYRFTAFSVSRHSPSRPEPAAADRMCIYVCNIQLRKRPSAESVIILSIGPCVVTAVS